MDGILIVDKAKGITSHDVIDFIRKRFKIKKVGHAGTLDPQASGVLVVLIGKFTKLSQKFSSQDKEYEACLTLGIATDSFDGEGKIVDRQEAVDLELEKIQKVLRQFLGKINQIPPMFSALKYKGRRLYALARQGVQVERPPRQIYIYKLEITEFSPPSVRFIVNCSKGTYIRSLCVDIAKKLGCPGYMSDLRRIRSGTFGIGQAIGLKQLELYSRQQLNDILLNNSIEGNEADPKY